MPPAKRASSATAKPSSKPASAASSKRRPAAKSAAPKAKSTTPRTTKTAKGGAKGTATAAASGTKATASRAKATNTRAKATNTRAKATNTRGRTTAHHREQITLTRGRIQEVLDDAASRGRITRKDANDLVAEIMRRGRHTGDEVAELVTKGRAQLESTAKKVRRVEPVDRIVRGADRARRAAGVGSTFPIAGYDDLNVSQVQARLKELTRPERRKVLNYERKHANRKSVVGALEKSLA